MRTREDLEAIEDQVLAPYAQRSRLSRGRLHPEPEHAYRTAFQRDRDRILHTTAFRRLKHKTQVFIITEGDYYRTRLTHTLEVAQIGRTIARALGVNEDLVEAICLAHDLGHPPFGHAGEQALNRLMQDHGGFEHNAQSFRIVTHLERRYPEFRGLNLTYEVLEGLVKHETEYDHPMIRDFEPHRRPTLEGQIANLADELAYTAHDLDDGLRAGLILPESLEGLVLWEELRRSIGWDGKGFNDLIRYRLVRRLIGIMVTDVITATDQRLQELQPRSPDELRDHPTPIVGFSEAMAGKVRELKAFLYRRLYRHPYVVRMQTKAERIVEALFRAYLQEPEQLPYWVQDRIREEGDLHRVVCDYIAGMTDRFALAEYRRLYEVTDVL